MEEVRREDMVGDVFDEIKVFLRSLDSMRRGRSLATGEGLAIESVLLSSGQILIYWRNSDKGGEEVWLST